MLFPLRHLSCFLVRLFFATLTEQGVGVKMESSGFGMASRTLLNYTGTKCVWLLIIWQAVYVCASVCVSVCSSALTCMH